MNNQPKYAGFWQRFGAYLLDHAILGFVKLILFVPVWFFFMFGLFSEYYHYDEENFTSIIFQSYYDSELNSSVFLLLLMIIIIVSAISIIGEWLYFALMESSNKQGTLGKIIIGIKVTDIFGNKISFGKATGRYFGKYLSGFILCVGYIMAAFTEKKQALHDILSGCLVVDKIDFNYYNYINQNDKSPQTN
ncbi:MAG: RDD family protein [Bacteroidota bacterium]